MTDSTRLTARVAVIVRSPLQKRLFALYTRLPTFKTCCEAYHMVHNVPLESPVDERC